MQLSSLVRGMLLHNYCIPFLSLLPPCFIKNNKSALGNADFVIAAIDELLHNTFILEVSSPPYYCNPLSVIIGRKLHLILDVSRSVNPFVQKREFTYLGDREQFLFFYFRHQVRLSSFRYLR